MKKRSLRIGIVVLSLFYFIGYSSGQTEVTPETALQHYLHNGDNSFQWELKDSFSLGHVTAYNLLLTSQKWRQYTWKHQLTVLVPNNNKYDGALLFITGGSLKDDEPRWNGKG